MGPRAIGTVVLGGGMLSAVGFFESGHDTYVFTRMHVPVAPAACGFKRPGAAPAPAGMVSAAAAPAPLARGRGRSGPGAAGPGRATPPRCGSNPRSEEHTSELQSPVHLV